jgi:hypothetical protein
MVSRVQLAIMCEPLPKFALIRGIRVSTPSGSEFIWLLCLLIGCLFQNAQCADESASATNSSVVITAGPDWIPLTPELEIEPGSALDLSGIGGTDSPAGKHGWVIAGQDGQFAFTDSPEIPRRFYGVNLCFTAQYLSHDQSDRLAQRLERLGYNAVRLHHYEAELTLGSKVSTTLNADKTDQLDYLVSALIRHGIYLTTDLFVSRPVRWSDIGMEQEGMVPMHTFKILVPIHSGAFENWKAFARNLLNHTNAYTDRRYADEPALAWIAMINEGNFGNFFKDLKTFPEWKLAWNRWLAGRYKSWDELARAWGSDLKLEEDSANDSVEFPDRLQIDGLRARDCIAFLGQTEKNMVARMKTFMHDELHCRALISNSSSWTRFTTDQATRQIYDYVDDHFYVDHPQFLETPWRLPSRSSNASPLAEGAPGGRSLSFTRLYGKPFTVTEFNYSGPGRYRGVGGILTGALGALQGWGGIWRFAYSHSREADFNPSRTTYFDVASDPLAQAAERASLCLFLRGDLKTAPHSVALTMTEADLAKPAARIPNLAPRWHWLAWVTRVGTEVVSEPATPLPHLALLPLGWQSPRSAYPRQPLIDADPYSIQNDKLVTALGQHKLFEPSDTPDPAKLFFRSETGELTIDGPGNRLILDTPKTAGGFAPDGGLITAANGGVRIEIAGSDATVWVSALDSKPIRSSHRLLVTHLTDLQNSGVTYRESARQTLIEWGGLPYLVRSGKATVSITNAFAGSMTVWALSPGGKRIATLPTRTQGGAFSFVAETGANPGIAARILYEVAD